ncbi:TolC family protein [Gaetbulibacter aestuarii]|uniref:TolC family protein n=1 Tax=Gaetbulibacter aestuarii TaxID=1502358 RepID=A0ABW7N2A2_9FLAO
MNRILLLFFSCFLSFYCWSQKKTGTLDYFVEAAKTHVPQLQENANLLKVGALQNDMIKAQNQGFKIDATSEVMVSPYFNNQGKVIDITTNPSPNAFGYDVGITNGGLYAAQINITKNLFNQAQTDNLLFQNKIQNRSIALSSDKIVHNLKKNIKDAYVMAYQFQLQKKFVEQVIEDLENRLQVVSLLVKKGVLAHSDYMLLELEVENKRLERQQIESNSKASINQLYSMSGIPVEQLDSLVKPNLEFTSQPKQYFYQKKYENDSLQLVADQRVFDNQYKPQLSAYANTGLNAVEIPNIDHKFGASAGIKLTIPIYDGHQQKIKEAQTQLKTETLEYYKQNLKNTLNNKFQSIENQINTLNNNMINLEVQIQKQAKVLDIYKGKLMLGQVSIVDYLKVVESYKLKTYTKLQMQTNYWLLINQYNDINW